jgi:thiosulfate sulfurtransferase
MAIVPEISITDLKAKLAAQAIVVLDIRAVDDYEAGHIDTAQLLTNDDLKNFIEHADKDRSYAVCCYRGISSQSAVLYLRNSGFKDVYSVSGGYNAWSQYSKESA